MKQAVKSIDHEPEELNDMGGLQLALVLRENETRPCKIAQDL